MAEYVTYFNSDEGVSRENFNSRIDQINSEFDKVEQAKGSAGGLATLNENGKLVQMPNASDVGAAAESHNQAASTITAGTFAETGVKAATGTDYTTARVRNIYAGTSAPSSLTNGDIFLLRES